MRTMMGLAWLVAVPLVAVAKSDLPPLQPRFVVSNDRLVPASEVLQNDRFELDSRLVERSGRADLQGALFELKAQLVVEGGGCTPDSIFEDGFEALP